MTQFFRGRTGRGNGGVILDGTDGKILHSDWIARVLPHTIHPGRETLNRIRLRRQRAPHHLRGLRCLRTILFQRGCTPGHTLSSLPALSN
jgi:hypothetical protein